MSHKDIISYVYIMCTHNRIKDIASNSFHILCTHNMNVYVYAFV